MYKISDIRRDYHKHVLHRKDLLEDPVKQFKTWLDYAISAEADDPTAMTLSTVNAAGLPSSRIVLLKNVTPEGFTFFTNYQSDKGRHLDFQPGVALNFYWPKLERQVRIEGLAQRTSAKVSDHYFSSRPKNSQLSALISPQSQVIEEDYLDKQVEKNRVESSSQNYHRPKHWGGYIVAPTMIEFWQGRSNRLHDRFRYEPLKDGWKIERLAP
jgi:pyridoxamine 5'-phosphate oxidase